MATAKPFSSESNELIDSLKEDWSSELCAEHDGTIPDFEKLSSRLNDLNEYKFFFDGSKWNLNVVGKITGGVLLGVAVFCPLAYLAAPGIASALGALGLLGAAGTGTAISTLGGAALTSASLAAIGGGTMLHGVILISAAGAALGGRQGGVISNNYFGDINDFKITKLKSGEGPAIIFIDGFLSEKDPDATHWINAVKENYPSNPYYYVGWESSTLFEIGSLIGKGIGGIVFQNFMLELMKRGSRNFAANLNPLNWASTVAELLGNPWHTSLVKASMTGILLADLLERTDKRDGFILIGHSLGARVIYYLLQAMSTKTVSPIRDVYLLGGTVDREDEQGWKNALKSVNGKIYNIYSDNDDTLKILYQVANALTSSPIGLGEIEVLDSKVININATHLVEGHMNHKECFGKILKHLI